MPMRRNASRRRLESTCRWFAAACLSGAFEFSRQQPADARSARRAGGRVRLLRPRPVVVAGLLRNQLDGTIRQAMRGRVEARFRHPRPVAAARCRLSKLLRAVRPVRSAGGGGRVRRCVSRSEPRALSVAQARHLHGRKPERLFPQGQEAARETRADPRPARDDADGLAGDADRDRARLRRSQSGIAARDDVDLLRPTGVPGNSHLHRSRPEAISGNARKSIAKAATRARSPSRRFDELSARVPRGKFRRRDEARAARANHRLSSAEGDADPRHRHPCGARASTTLRETPPAGPGNGSRASGGSTPHLRPRSRNCWRRIGRSSPTCGRVTGQTIYPGSPGILREILRRQDRGVLVELHPADHKVLSRAFNQATNLKVLASRRLDRAPRADSAEGKSRAGADRPALRGDSNELERLGTRTCRGDPRNGRMASMPRGIRSRQPRPSMPSWRGFDAEMPAAGPAARNADRRSARPDAAQRKRASGAQPALRPASRRRNSCFPRLPNGCRAGNMRAIAASRSARRHEVRLSSKSVAAATVRGLHEGAVLIFAGMSAC